MQQGLINDGEGGEICKRGLTMTGKGERYAKGVGLNDDGEGGYTDMPKGLINDGEGGGGEISRYATGAYQ